MFISTDQNFKALFGRALASKKKVKPGKAKFCWLWLHCIWLGLVSEAILVYECLAGFLIKSVEKPCQRGPKLGLRHL